MKNVNIFTLMMAVAVFAVVLRMVDIAHIHVLRATADATPQPAGFQKLAENAPAPAAAPAKDAAPEAKPAADTAGAGATPAPAAAAGQQQDQTPKLGEPAYSAAEIEVLESLSKRREELDRREQVVSQKEALLKAAETEVDRKIAELNQIKKQLEDLLNKQKGVEEDRINSLVKIYEGMKPKDAARIFDSLDMDVLLPVVGKMKENKVSPIIALMDPDKAKALTIKLAEQHKLPSADDIKKDQSAGGTANPPPLPVGMPK